MCELIPHLMLVEVDKVNKGRNLGVVQLRPSSQPPPLSQLHLQLHLQHPLHRHILLRLTPHNVARVDSVYSLKINHGSFHVKFVIYTSLFILYLAIYQRQVPKQKLDTVGHCLAL